MANKVKFGSRIGLIAATVGSAVGLGNVWRFPAEAQSNGGAAFDIVYILCAATGHTGHVGRVLSRTRHRQ